MIEPTAGEEASTISSAPIVRVVYVLDSSAIEVAVATVVGFGTGYADIFVQLGGNSRMKC